MYRFRGHVLVAVLLALLRQTAATLADERPGILRAGAALVDITPSQFPVVVNGMFTERSATRAYDRLSCRCLILDDGRTTLALAVVDSCMMPREFLDRTKELAKAATGIPVENMLISATHTHSAPAVMGCLGSDADPMYPAFLQGEIVRALTLAAKSKVAARAGWAVTSAPAHTHNRRWIYRSDRMLIDPFGERTVHAHMHPGYLSPDAIGPSGPVDPGLSLLAVQTIEGKPLAVLANYSMHYFGSPPLSSDYFGLFCDQLAQRIGHGATPLVIMSQGTSGDLASMDYGNPKIDQTIEKYTAGLVDIAHDAYRGIRFQEQVPLGIKEVKLTFARRVPDERRLEWAKKIVDGLNGRKPTTQPEIYAREQLFLSATPSRELKLQALRIGELGIVAIPNEVFSITGLSLKALSPLEPTFVIELANGSEGYIPPPAQHALGGYTTWPARTAALEVEAEPKIVETLLRALEAVSGKPRRIYREPLGPYVEAIKKAKPCAFWRLDEFHGPTAADTQGNHPATYEGAVAFCLEGPTSPAFSGPTSVNRCVHVAGGCLKSPSIKLPGPNSVELWIWNGFPVDVRPVTGYFISRGNKHLDDLVGIGGTTGEPGKLFVQGGSKNGPEGTSPLAWGGRKLPLRTWHHIVLTRDANDVVKVYLDGTLEIDTKMTLSDPGLSGQWYIGGNVDGPGLEGRIDEVAIYDRLLTSEEVLAHYRLGQSN
jgi:Concanavalin A-like lectin/glucanases superfamily